MSEYKFVRLVFFVISVSLINGYAIPAVTIQALKNGEFRAHIPDSKGVKGFEVHAKINDKIAIQEVGDFFVNVKEKTLDYWIATFPNTNIKVGDTVYAWVSVIVDNFSYRMEHINVTIAELYDAYPVLPVKCITSSTVYDNGKKACVGFTVFMDEFKGTEIDATKWTAEQWIPTATKPSYIFNSYEKRADTCYVKDDNLLLKPIALQSGQELRGTLDLQEGCTSSISSECIQRSISSNLLPPIKSAKIRSKISFKYGRVDVRAKLPAGDWIFPIIQLEPKIKKNGENSPKIVIAYSIGNDVLRGPSGADIGSRILLGGPLADGVESRKTPKLVSWRERNPFYDQFRVYTLEWQPGKMSMKVDEQEYGLLDLNTKQLVDDIDVRGGSGSGEFPFNTEFVVSLGVAVGGLVDFPDGFTSGDYVKPWTNEEPKFILHFFEKRPQWIRTWRGENAAMRVDYVKVTAL